MKFACITFALICAMLVAISVHSSEEHESEQASPVSNASENVQDGREDKLVQKLDPQNPSNDLNHKQQAEGILEQYVKSDGAKGLEEFVSILNPDATENVKYPQKSMTTPRKLSEQQSSQAVSDIVTVENGEKKLNSQPTQKLGLQEQKKENNLQSRAEEILTLYVRSYRTKKLKKLFALFHPDATENGQLHSGLIDQYQYLFTQTETIQLDLDSILWKENKNGIEAECTFRASYTYKDGHAQDHSGDIMFYFTDAHETLKILSLDYIFVN